MISITCQSACELLNQVDGNCGPKKKGASLRYETTVQRPVEASGVGLHSGVPVRIRILPAPAATGIVFLRTDLDGFAIPASWRHVARVSYATSLMRQGVLISTTEHLLSVLYSMGVDNAYIEIDNLEVPILDGSGLPFVRLLDAAGRKNLRRKRRYLRVRRPVSIEDRGRRISILPADTFHLTCDVFFHHPLVGRQVLEMELTPQRYAGEIAPARTFGFTDDLDQLRNMGLIRGASLDNAVCVNGRGVMNPGGLRFAEGRRLLPAQGAGPDRRPGADRPAAAGPGDRRARRSRHACRAGEPHHERPLVIRDPDFRSTGHPCSARTGILMARQCAI
jgi:UDP-3-O-[3-hydroxymyristoyl] N-acetylglucosamine deacetylase